MHQKEFFGLLATFLISYSALFKYQRSSRYINIVASAFLIIYGILISSPTVVLVSIVLTCVRMNQIFKPQPIRPGCIIMGYQGIGKSTISAVNSTYIDLESSSFYVNGVKDRNWYQPYCKIAIDLAVQGYNVFVSTHLCVREYLTTVPIPQEIELIVCYPCYELKDEWIKKLLDRYNSTHLDRDYRAYVNALDNFDTNIHDLKETKAIHAEITSIDYDLSEVIDKIRHNR